MLHLARFRVTPYAIAVLASAVALLPRKVLGPTLMPNPFVGSYVAVAVATWFGGVGPGMLATLLAMALTEYLFLPSITDQNVQLRIALFLFAAAATCWLTAWFRRLHHDLRGAVRQRTAELSEANARLHAQLAETQQTQAVLHEIQERFGNAFTHAPIGMALAGFDGRPLQVNHALCTMLGYSEAELLASGVREATSPQDLETGRDYGRRLVRGELDSFQQERQYVHKSGRIVHGLLNVSLVRDRNAKPLYFVCQVQDITERKCVEEALRKSEERYAWAVAGANDGLWDWNLHTNEFYASPRCTSILGIEEAKRDYLIEWTERVHREDRDALQAAMEAHLEGRTPFFEHEYRLGDGDHDDRWVLSRGLLVRDHDGAPSRMAGSLRDITRRKRAEHQLRDSESRFRTLAETVAAAIFIFQDAHLRYVNRAAIAITGYSPDELLAMSFWDLIHPEFRDLVRERGLARQRGEPVPTNYEVKILTKQGEERWMAFVGGVMQFDGRPAVLATAFDVTERKRAEAALRKAHDELETRVAQRTVELSNTNRLLQEQITQRRQVEDALRESERRFRAIVDHAGVGVSLMGADLRWRLVNDKFCQMLGYRRDELLQRTFRDVTHPDDVEADEAMIRRLVNREVDFHSTEKRYVRKDGSIIWVDLTASVLRDSAGRAQYGIAVTQDITERKRAEEALRTSEERFRLLSESSPIGVYHTDLNGHCLYSNARWQAISGLNAEASLGLGWATALHPDDYEWVLAAWSQCVREGRDFSDEFRLRRQSGEVRWIHSRAAPLRSETGQIVGYVGTVEDVTERRRAEEALRETNQTLQALINALPLAIIAMDPDGNVTLWSPAAERIFGWSEPEVLHGPLPFVPENQKGQFRRLFEDAFRGVGHSGFEMRRLRKDGSLIDVSLWSAPLRHAEGTVRSVIGIVADITERKRAERELRELNERIQGLLESITDGFFALDNDGRFTYVNPSAAQMLQRNREELIGKFAQREFPRDVDSTFYEQFQRALAEGVTTTAEGYYPPLRRWFKARTYPSEGRTSVLFEDITERHSRELTIVSDILQALNSVLDVADAFPDVAAGLRALTGCDRSSLVLFDGTQEWGTVVAVDEPRPDIQPGSRLRFSHPAARTVMAGQPYRIPDLAADLDSPIVQTLYASGMRSALALPMRGSRPEVLGMVTLTWRQIGAGELVQMPLLQQIASAVALAAEKGLLFEQVRAGHERLQALSHRLIEVQEVERRHLARELHDEVGQALTGLRLVLDSVAGSSGQVAETRLQEAHQTVSQLVGRVRDLSLDLRPAMLDDLGLLPALLWLFQRYTSQTNIQVVFEHRGLERRFTPGVETAAYRIVQEALTNVARHARVSQATVRAWADSSSLGVQIVDAGPGFDAEAALASGATGGLAGMRERAELLGGQLTLESDPAGVTRVRADLPLGERPAWEANGRQSSAGG